ncbi:hypothetical protein ACQ4M3_20810 [Leptolyngbya sp. AN03gr2]|uniref:hypothetical protein n=1 Tax=unclassified Leptolyngbya TaxID=2650499 RepID=UPI003D3174B7
MQVFLIVLSVCAGVSISITCGFVWGKKQALRKTRSQIKRLAFYENLWREKQGKTPELEHYHFISLDGGETWIAVEQDEKGFRIVGELEPIHTSENPNSSRETPNSFGHAVKFHSPFQSEIYRRAKSKFKKL